MIRRLDARVRREARVLLREVRRGLRKPDRVPAGVRAEIGAAAAALERAGREKDRAGLRRGLVELGDLADEHLAGARKSVLREYGESIAAAVAVAFVLRLFVIEAFKIPSGSMIPTMEIGDHIFVNKLPYGIGIPFTSSKLLRWRGPARGEVIVFTNPCHPDKDFIKRVVAVAGDRLEVRCDLLWVNGVPVPAESVATHRRYWDYKDQASAMWGLGCDSDGDDRWARCAASDWLERQGGYGYHTFHGLDRTTRESVSEHDFPRLPDRPDELAAVVAVLGGRPVAELAAGLAVEPDEVMSWFPPPAACGEPDSGWSEADRFAARGDLVAGKGGAAGSCAPRLAYRVPAGHVFVMGDNRDKSQDSRIWGPVPVDRVKGKAMFIWWSAQPANAGGTQWHRMGKIVH